VGKFERCAMSFDGGFGISLPPELDAARVEAARFLPLVPLRKPLSSLVPPGADRGGGPTGSAARCRLDGAGRLPYSSSAAP
jgi:hypothetical protein